MTMMILSSLKKLIKSEIIGNCDEMIKTLVNILRDPSYLNKYELFYFYFVDIGFRCCITCYAPANLQIDSYILLYKYVQNISILYVKMLVCHYLIMCIKWEKLV